MISQLILTIARLKKKGGNEKINDATTHRHNKTAVFNMMHQLNNDLCFASEYSDNCVYQFKCQESITDESVLPNSADHPWLKGTSHAFPPPNTFKGPHDSAGGQDKARIKKSVKTTNVAVYTALDACCAAKAQYKRNCGIGSSTPSDEEPAEPSMPENWEENWCKVNDQDAYRVLKKESYAETAVFHIFSTEHEEDYIRACELKRKGELDEVVRIDRNTAVQTHQYTGSSEIYQLKSGKDSVHDNQNNQTTITMRRRPCCCRACLTNEQQQYNPDITNSTDPKPCQHEKMNGTPFQVTHHLSGNQNHVNLTKHALIQNQIDFMKNVLSLTLQKRKDVPIKLKKDFLRAIDKQKGIKKYFSVPRIGDLTKDNYSEYFGSKSESEYIMKKGEDALEKLQQELETL